MTLTETVDACKATKATSRRQFTMTGVVEVDALRPLTLPQSQTSGREDTTLALLPPDKSSREENAWTTRPSPPTSLVEVT